MAALADDIAYHSHDLDDGWRGRSVRAGRLAHLPMVGEALAEARRASLDVPPPRLRHETIRRVIHALVTDLVAETGAAHRGARPRRRRTTIRRAGRPVVAFSPAMAEANRVIKEFLFARMYRHWRVNRMTAKARRLISELFTLLHGQTGLLPDDWRARAGEGGSRARGDGGRATTSPA